MQGILQENLNAISQAIDLPGPSDEDLVLRLRSEDSDALSALFQRYSKLVFGIALRVLRDTGEAEEVVQESFLYMYRKAVLFEPSRGSARVWIIQIAYSRARDRKAHLARRGFYLRSNVEALDLDETLPGRADMEEEIAVKLDFDRLQCTFDELTEMQRETLRLFYFEGLQLREISERFSEPLGNIRHHFYRGMERLRKSTLIKKLRKNSHAKN